MRFHATLTGDGKSSHSVWLADTFVLAQCFESSHGGDGCLRQKGAVILPKFLQASAQAKEGERTILVGNLRKLKGPCNPAVSSH